VGNSSTTLLFLFRVRAVYGGSKFIVGFFGLMWVTHLGLTIMVPLSLEGKVMGPTKMCYSTPLRPFAAASLILNGVYDTLVFLAISFRIASYSMAGDTLSMRIKCVFTAGGLPRLSRDLLHSGQLYYFASTLMTGGACILVFTPNIPPFYRALLAVPSVTFPSIMACRVFRDTRLGFIQDAHPTSFLGTMPVFTDIAFASVPLSNLVLDGSRGFRSNIPKVTAVGGGLRHGAYTEHATDRI